MLMVTLKVSPSGGCAGSRRPRAGAPGSSPCSRIGVGQQYAELLTAVASDNVAFAQALGHEADLARVGLDDVVDDLLLEDLGAQVVVDIAGQDDGGQGVPRRASMVPAGDQAPRLRDMPRILAVDDSTSTHQVVSLALTRAGYEVLKDQDGQEALEIAKGETVDAAIIDINMPRLDGISLVRALPTLTPGEVDAEDVNALFRFVHTLKGGSATFGFGDIAAFSHPDPPGQGPTVRWRIAFRPDPGILAHGNELLLKFRELAELGALTTEADCSGFADPRRARTGELSPELASAPRGRGPGRGRS